MTRITIRNKLYFDTSCSEVVNLDTRGCTAIRKRRREAVAVGERDLLLLSPVPHLRSFVRSFFLLSSFASSHISLSPLFVHVRKVTRDFSFAF